MTSFELDDGAPHAAKAQKREWSEPCFSTIEFREAKAADSSGPDGGLAS